MSVELEMGMEMVVVVGHSYSTKFICWYCGFKCWVGDLWRENRQLRRLERDRVDCILRGRQVNIIDDVIL